MTGRAAPRPGVRELRRRLEAAEEALRALQAGEVDALVVTRPRGDHVVVLAGAELAYRLLFDEMNEGAVTLTVDGVIAHCNRRFAEIVHAPLEQVIGTPLRRFVQPGDIELCEQLRQTGSRENARADLGFQTGDGAPVPVAVSFAPLHAEGESTVIGVVGVIRDISERRQQEEVRGRLIEQVMHAQDEERRRIARELHDETGQSLTALLVGLRTIQEARTLGEAAALAERLREVVARTLVEVGRLSRGLHPIILDDAGLATAVRRQVREFVQLHGITADVRIEGLETKPLPPLLETTVYRVLQEALTNVAKHARARQVNVRLLRNDTSVELRLQDDGIGFEPALPTGTTAAGVRRGLGLRGARERAALLGGAVQVVSAAGRGTEITARFPVSRA